MKSLFFFTSLLTTLSAYTQLNVSVKWLQQLPAAKNDTIYYNPDKKLTWLDFKGKPDEHSDATAITASGFGYQSAMQYRSQKTTIEIAVFCYFAKQNSWVRGGKESDYALNHEQHHFDITYIIANLLIQKFKAAKFTRSNYADLIEKIYNESCQELEKMQNDYDGQTRNGRLKNIQTNWNENVEKQLNLLPAK
ncbi:MAG: hypothetical protein RIR31_1416 [Bacteroidota bacterium]|jgi:hypothetical protein